MIAIACERAPELAFAVGSMLCLPAADGAWAGAVALYSIIHLTTDQRATACREFARVVRSGGWLLVSFHVDSDEFAMMARLERQPSPEVEYPSRRCYLLAQRR